jgi:hypothetical protein
VAQAPTATSTSAAVVVAAGTKMVPVLSGCLVVLAETLFLVVAVLEELGPVTQWQVEMVLPPALAEAAITEEPPHHNLALAQTALSSSSFDRTGK